MCGTKQTKRNGYTIELPERIINDDDCYEEIYITFPSFDDYQKILNIEELMYKLHIKKSIRKDEEKFYKHLKKIENIIKDCEHMELETNEESSFDKVFTNIVRFLYKSAYGFKHNNKKLQKKFHKVAEDLWGKEICPFQFRFI